MRNNLDEGKNMENRIEKNQSDQQKKQSKTDKIKKETAKKLSDNFKKK